ncbi:MAG: response regulator [Myxococcota bacterium]
MSKKILVVDDSKTIRMSLTEILGRLGNEVLLAETGDDALQQVKGGLTADLVITDYNMPGMNGIELIEALRKEKAFRFLPILVLTTETQGDLRQAAKKAGATGWLVKPVNAQQLVQVVNQVMPGS